MKEQRYIKLSEYARLRSITYTTAWNHFKCGKIPSAIKDEAGNILIPIVDEIDYSKCAIYARVSSNAMKDNLIRQQNRLEEFAVGNDYEVIVSIREIASGMNDNRKKLTNKRNNKIIDYLHKSSRLLVNQLVEAGVGTLVIGKNTNQKQDINIGKVGNQNFTSLPLFKFLDTVAYKCKLEGIEVIFHEESYTSKCSFLDSEPVRKHEIYAGSRIKRGLFRSYNGSFINADLNGSYNIMKKVFPNAFVDGIQGCAVTPLRLTPTR